MNIKDMKLNVFVFIRSMKKIESLDYKCRATELQKKMKVVDGFWSRDPL